MSRISACFEALQARHRTALVPFVTAGDPTPDVTLPLMHAMVEAGADLIELGVPFSDPMADGPVIQRASERALEHHTSLHQVLDMVRGFRERDPATPVILMGYLNPIEVMGYRLFAEQAQAAGVDGVLIVDVPPEEGQELVQILRSADVDLIYLLAPTSTQERIRRITDAASGFVYYVSVKGVTGAGHLDLESVKTKLSQIRAVTQLPVGVGFGIKDAETAARVGEVADAVIVGSAVVGRLEALVDRPQRIPAEISDFLSGLRLALDQGNKT
jgi:tryptophan synthase alpha chain